MDSAEDEAFDRAVRLACTAIGSPVGLVSFVDGERQFFKAQQGLTGGVRDARQTPLTHSFCQYVTTEDRLLAVDDAREHAVLKSNMAVDDLGVIAYLGVPIHAPGGATLGSFCAIFDGPHTWTDTEKRVLTDIAAMLETELALREVVKSKDMLLREMAHRIANLFSIVLGMIRMTKRSAPSVDAFSDTLCGRIEGLRRAHSMVKPENLDAEVEDVTNSLHSIISNLVEPHLHLEHEQLTLTGPTLQAGSKATTNLALVIHEIATNAVKYGALSVPEGQVTVEWAEDGDEIRLDWHEAGGPEIAGPPKSSGFGSVLIGATVRDALGGRFETAWNPTGVSHQIVMARQHFDH